MAGIKTARDAISIDSDKSGTEKVLEVSYRNLEEIDIAWLKHL